MTTQPKVLPKPVDWEEMYPGRFLKASDLKGKNVTLKIASLDIEELIGDRGPQIKGVVGFDKTEKKLALNKTNGICLKGMFGKKVQEWVGKRVTLMTSSWDGEECIRIFGSPDIAENITLTIALPRKRPYEMIMHRGAPPEAKADKKGDFSSSVIWAGADPGALRGLLERAEGFTDPADVAWARALVASNAHKQGLDWDGKTGTYKQRDEK